jgi:hypothetical protein
MQSKSGGSICHPLGAAQLAPDLHGMHASNTLCFGISVVTAKLDGNGHLVVNQNKALQLT